MIRKCLMISRLSYPYGGGESFFLQTINWLSNYEIIWISFQSHTKGNYTTEEIITHPTYTEIHILRNKLSHWLNKISPTVIHTMPEKDLDLIFTLEESGIPVLLGYHFWWGLICTDKLPINVDMEHNETLYVDPVHLAIFSKNLFTTYVASDFMNTILSSLNQESLPVIYPTSEHHSTTLLPFEERKYISMINCNPLKGGDIVLNLASLASENISFDSYPFRIVSSDSSELDEKFQNLSNVTFSRYTDVKEIYSTSRIILIPTQLDETFCRVAYEAADNGIAIITTGKGFIRQMLGDAGLYANTVEEFQNIISQIYDDETLLTQIGNKLKQQVSRFSSKDDFISMIEELNYQSPRNNIGIFCPWGDQGLGIQSRMYAKHLSSDYTVHIFSYKSYFGDSEIYQSSPSEWKWNCIYYSLHEREEVTEKEITRFVRSRKIGTMLIPEIGSDFSLFKHLKKMGVKVIAIPNIEVLRFSNLKDCEIFDKILCPTKQCYDVLSSSLTRCEYLSHPLRITKSFIYPNRISFLCLGGYNPSRKNVEKVLKAFAKACEKRDDIYLTVTTSVFPTYLQRLSHPQIKIILRNLSNEEVKQLYEDSSVVVQVSTHEGLGLGFFEALEHGRPVVSINAAPHNEVVTDKNGWLLKCTSFPLPDNPEGLVTANMVNEKELQKLFENISLQEINEKIVYISDHIDENRNLEFLKFCDKINV